MDFRHAPTSSTFCLHSTLTSRRSHRFPSSIRGRRQTFSPEQWPWFAGSATFESTAGCAVEVAVLPRIMNLCSDIKSLKILSGSTRVPLLMLLLSNTRASPRPYAGWVLWLALRCLGENSRDLEPRLPRVQQRVAPLALTPSNVPGHLNSWDQGTII